MTHFDKKDKKYTLTSLNYWRTGDHPARDRQQRRTNPTCRARTHPFASKGSTDQRSPDTFNTSNLIRQRGC